MTPPPPFQKFIWFGSRTLLLDDLVHLTTILVTGGGGRSAHWRRGEGKGEAPEHLWSWPQGKSEWKSKPAIDDMPLQMESMMNRKGELPDDLACFLQQQKQRQVFNHFKPVRIDKKGMLHCTDSHDCAMCILKWPPKCIVSWKNAGETGDDDEVVPLLRGRGARGRAREAGAEEEENRARGESRCPSRDKLEEGQKNRLLIPSPVVWALGFLLTVVYFSVSWHVLFHKELFLLDRFFPGHILLRSPNNTDSTKAVKERAERIISGSRDQPGHILRLIVQLDDFSRSLFVICFQCSRSMPYHVSSKTMSFPFAENQLLPLSSRMPLRLHELGEFYEQVSNAL